MDLKALQQTLRTFAAERNWEQFHTPKNLSMALMVEAAELMELFQWRTPQESQAAATDKALQVRIGEELVDVLLYLLQLADHAGVDLDHAVEDKLLKNAKKHALPDTQVTVAQADLKPGQTHVLVDWENVQPKDGDIRDLVPGVTHVWIFHGRNQRRVEENQRSFGDALTLVPISRPGKNALDFHLSYYVGYISSRNPDARFVVISNDQGYGPMLEHAKELGFAAGRVGFGNPQAVPRKAPATTKAAPAKKSTQSTQTATPTQPRKSANAPAAKTTAASAKAATTESATKMPVAVKPVHAPVPAKRALPSKPKARTVAVASTTSATSPKSALATSKKAAFWDDQKTYAHVLDSLRRSRNKPTRRARLHGAVKSLLGIGRTDDAGVERVVNRLIAEGHLEIDVNGKVTKSP